MATKIPPSIPAEMEKDYQWFLMYRKVSDRPSTRSWYLQSKRKGRFEELYWSRRRRENTRRRGRFWGPSSGTVFLNNTYIYGPNGHAGGRGRNGER